MLNYERLNEEIFHETVTETRASGWKQFAFHAENHARQALFDQLNSEEAVRVFKSQTSASYDNSEDVSFQEALKEQFKYKHRRLSMLALGAEVASVEGVREWQGTRFSLDIAALYGKITQHINGSLQYAHRVEKNKKEMMRQGIFDEEEMRFNLDGMRLQTEAWIAAVYKTSGILPSDEAVRIVLIDKFPILPEARYGDVTRYLATPDQEGSPAGWTRAMHRPRGAILH